MNYYINVDRGMGVKTYVLVDAYGNTIEHHAKRKSARRHKRWLKWLQRDIL